MKAVRIHEFGGPDVLHVEEIPRPSPAADEVLIKVHAAGVNPVDWKIRKGFKKDSAKLPFTPGWDVSGVIEQKGTKVKKFRNGDEVYSRPDFEKNGTYAEYVTVKANQVNLKPKSIDHVKAAAVPLAGLTAWQGLFDHGHLEPGQKVLIHAASGGVGSYAVQFAKWKGAYVIGTTSNENIDFVKQLGADKVIDYKNEKFEEEVNAVDLVLDTIGGDTQKRSLEVIKPGGRLITTVAAEFEADARQKNIILEGFLDEPNPDQLKTIAELIDTGKVTPVVTEVLPLEKAAEAQQISEEGHVRGKIVLKVV